MLLFLDTESRRNLSSKEELKTWSFPQLYGCCVPVVQPCSASCVSRGLGLGALEPSWFWDNVTSLCFLLVPFSQVIFIPHHLLLAWSVLSSISFCGILMSHWFLGWVYSFLFTSLIHLISHEWCKLLSELLKYPVHHFLQYPQFTF